MQKKFNYVLFDLDGTLLDTAPDFITAINRLLAANNFQSSIEDALPRNLLNYYISLGSEHIIKAIFKIDEKSLEFKNLLEQFLDFYYQTNHLHTELFAGMLDVITTLNHNKVPWGIVTNKPTWLTMPIIANKPYLHQAATIVCGDTTPYMKPHPQPLYFACNAINAKPEDGVYIGDAKRDIIAGNSANMTTVAALFGYIPNQMEALSWPANYFTSTVQELHALLCDKTI